MLDSQEKQKQIVAMFDDIATSYDVANRILSLGIDKLWRRDSIQRALSLSDSKKPKIIDVACGTGDMLQFWNDALGKDGASLIGVDPSSGMLKIAKKKLATLNVELHQAMAQNLQFLEDQSADIISISFGLRNVTDLRAGISEFSRVLRPNGVLLILEFMKKDKWNLIDRMTRIYTTKILPLIGGLISRNYRAYAYLPNSIDGFKSAEEMIEILGEFGLKTRMTKAYSSGIATLILCQKGDL